MSDATDKLIGVIPAVIGLKIVERVLDEKPRKKKFGDGFKPRRW